MWFSTQLVLSTGGEGICLEMVRWHRVQGALHTSTIARWTIKDRSFSQRAVKNTPTETNYQEKPSYLTPCLMPCKSPSRTASCGRTSVPGRHGRNHQYFGSANTGIATAILVGQHGNLFSLPFARAHPSMVSSGRDPTDPADAPPTSMPARSGVSGSAVTLLRN